MKTTPRPGGGRALYRALKTRVPFLGFVVVTFSMAAAGARGVEAQPPLKLRDGLVVSATAADFASSGQQLTDDWVAFFGQTSGTVRFEAARAMLVRVAVEAFGTPVEDLGPDLQLDLDSRPVFVWNVAAAREKPA